MLKRLTKREACQPRSLGIRLQDGRDVSALVYIYEGKNILDPTTPLAEKASMVVRAGVHPVGWTGGAPENRLTEPGFRGESPWLSTARIRSSSSVRSSRSSWAESRPTPSPSATASAVT